MSLAPRSPIVEDTSMDVSSPTFPPEIIDRIIDCLRGHPSDLCNCALTCHAWLPRSRYNLFHTMSICTLEALESLASISCMPHILPHFHAVHQLSLEDARRPSAAQSKKSATSKRKARVRPFMHLLPLLLPHALRSTRVLEITRADWRAFPPHPSTRLHRSTFESVTTLTLSGCWFGSCNEFVRLISSFPSLLHLSLINSAWDNERSPGAAHPPPALKSLSFSSTRDKETNVVMEWALLYHNSCSLRYLSFDSYSPSAAIVRKVAPTIGLQLESLHLVRHPPFRGDADICELFFTACSSLLSLRVNIYGALEKLPWKLSLLTSWCLRSITLFVNTAVDTAITFSEQLSSWTQIDDVLAREQFASLEAVDITWVVMWDVKQEDSAPSLVLADYFPQLCARGIFTSTVSMYA
ncbi:hypothetical protein B0H21DRAFT_219875 [Amylocystis lapponica]|nr:hypothetical protein B0H21DRAFT_219875 [Amylocystis lapponica]